MPSAEIEFDSRREERRWGSRSSGLATWGQGRSGPGSDMQGRTPAFANPFLSPEFTIAVGRLRQAALVAVLTEGQDITGFFPFERRRLRTWRAYRGGPDRLPGPGTCTWREMGWACAAAGLRDIGLAVRSPGHRPGTLRAVPGGSRPVAGHRPFLWLRRVSRLAAGRRSRFLPGDGSQGPQARPRSRRALPGHRTRGTSTYCARLWAGNRFSIAARAASTGSASPGLSSCSTRCSQHARAAYLACSPCCTPATHLSPATSVSGRGPSWRAGVLPMTPASRGSRRASFTISGWRRRARPRGSS